MAVSELNEPEVFTLKVDGEEHIVETLEDFENLYKLIEDKIKQEPSLKKKRRKRKLLDELIEKSLLNPKFYENKSIPKFERDANWSRYGNLDWYYKT